MYRRQLGPKMKFWSNIKSFKKSLGLKSGFFRNFFSHMALIIFCKCVWWCRTRMMFLIVIGYDNHVKGIFSCLNVLSFPFVHFDSPRLYHYQRVSTKSKLSIGWLYFLWISTAVSAYTGFISKFWSQCGLNVIFLQKKEKKFEVLSL